MSTMHGSKCTYFQPQNVLKINMFNAREDALVTIYIVDYLAFQFKGHSITQRGVSVASPQILESITVCLWVSAPSEYVRTHPATLLSYATPKARTWGNDFRLASKTDLDIYINGEKYRSGVVIADGKFHHVCVTWDSASGKAQIYKNGNLGEIMVNIKTGEQIKGGGIWVIGQDQDSLGAGFQVKNSFKGILAEVNIWDRVLGSGEIKSFAKDCNLLPEGNYKTYYDFDMFKAERVTRNGCGFLKIS